MINKPMLAAALDHEERRLPLDAVLRASEQRLAGSLMTLLQRHRAELPRAPDGAMAQDCLVIAKAMIEADAQLRSRRSPDLLPRLERALVGYLSN